MLNISSNFDECCADDGPKKQIKREEHIMVVLVPWATDEWLNGVPVGILSLAFAPLH